MVPKPPRTTNSGLEQERHRVLAAFQKAFVPPEEGDTITASQEDKIDWEYENEKFDLENRKRKKDLRERWNWVLLVLVVAGFVFSYVVIFMIGRGWLRFADNAFAVPSVVAAGIIQTYGLARLAIRYFFSEDGGHKPRK